MNVAAIPCQLPSTGASGVPILVIGVSAIAVGVLLMRVTSPKHRLPLAMILLLIAGLCATAPHPASASDANCSPTTTAFAWPDFDGQSPSAPVCDKLQRLVDGGIEFFPNIGWAVDTGSGNGTYFGYSTNPNDPDYLENPTAWLDGFTPNQFSYEWQTLVSGVWETASWDTGTNPLTVNTNTVLLNTISGALSARTARLFVDASDGTIEQGCPIYYTELPG